MFNTYKHMNNLYAYAISLNLLKYHDEQPLFEPVGPNETVVQIEPVAPNDTVVSLNQVGAN